MDLLQSWGRAEKAPWPGPDQATIPNRLATKAALGSCRDRPSSAPACRRATWWRTAPSVTPRSRAMWLLVAPRAAKVLMVMRASGLSRFILAAAETVRSEDLNRRRQLVNLAVVLLAECAIALHHGGVA